MSEDLREVAVSRRTLSLRHGSDLLWLWEWYSRIDAWLPEGEAGRSTWMVFLPSKEMDEAVIAFSRNYRLPMEMVQESLSEAKKLYDVFLATRDEDKMLEFYETLEVLRNRLESIVLVIYDDEIESLKSEYLAALKRKEEIDAKLAEPDSKSSADMKKVFPLGIPDDPVTVAMGVEVYDEQKKPENERRSKNEIARKYAAKTGLKVDTLKRTLFRSQTGK